jgi:catechol 2,3-dioxygenase-like lactoylglutathione lyase family enzyme
MSFSPAFDAIDHLHVHVKDRPAAEAWYARVLGLTRMAEYEHWAQDGGPLTLADAAGHLHLALFQRPPQGGLPTIALRVSAAGLLDWRAHLRRELGQAPALVDHGESRSIYFSDPDGNGFEITSYEREGDGPVLRELLDEELGRAPEYLDAQQASSGDLPPSGGAYSSHLPMALHALAALGAGEARLRGWARTAFADLPTISPWPELDAAERRHAEALASESTGALLARRLPLLMPGCGAMAFHALIRTAHAWEAGHKPQLARALAYWTVRSAPLQGPAEIDGERLGLHDWLDGLLALPVPDNMNQPWISARMLHAAAQPGFQAIAPRLRLEPGLLADIAHWAASTYAGSGNFTILHLLTATRAMSLLLPLLAPGARPAALRDFTRQAGAALIASRWRGQLSSPPAAGDWDSLRAAAIAQDDEHAIKLVHAAWQLGRTDSDPIWRQAAARALHSLGSAKVVAA